MEELHKLAAKNRFVFPQLVSALDVKIEQNTPGTYDLRIPGVSIYGNISAERVIDSLLAGARVNDIWLNGPRIITDMRAFNPGTKRIGWHVYPVTTAIASMYMQSVEYISWAQEHVAYLERDLKIAILSCTEITHYPVTAPGDNFLFCRWREDGMDYFIVEARESTSRGKYEEIILP